MPHSLTLVMDKSLDEFCALGMQWFHACAATEYHCV